jgi:uncharacterized protein YggE
MRIYIVALIYSLLLANPAQAQETAKPQDIPNLQCSLSETPTLSISFSGARSSVAEALKAYNATLQDILKEARSRDITLTVQSENVSVNNSSYGAGNDSSYQYSGSISYLTKTTDDLWKLLEALSLKKYQASANVNKYSNGAPCTQN